MYLFLWTRNALAPVAAATAPPPIDGTTQPKQKTEVTLFTSPPAYNLRDFCQADEIMEKIYSNMSACHLKQGNWKRAIETADKVRHLR